MPPPGAKQRLELPSCPRGIRACLLLETSRTQLSPTLCRQDTTSLETDGYKNVCCILSSNSFRMCFFGFFILGGFAVRCPRTTDRLEPLFTPLMDLSRYLQHFAKVQAQLCCYLRYMAEKRPGGTRFPIGIAIFPGTLRESPVPTLLLFAILGKKRLPKLLLFTRFRESRPPTLLLFAILRETRDFRLVLFTRSRASPRANLIGIYSTSRSEN